MKLLVTCSCNSVVTVSFKSANLVGWCTGQGYSLLRICLASNDTIVKKVTNKEMGMVPALPGERLEMG